MRHYYEITKDLVIRYVYMEGKYNYKHKKVVSEIQKFKKQYTGENIVCYVFDKDEHDKSPRDEKFFQEVCSYCDHLHYDIIWFVKNIEHVL